MNTLKRHNFFAKLSFLYDSRLFLFRLLSIGLYSAVLFSFIPHGLTQNYYGHQFVNSGKPSMERYQSLGKTAFDKKEYNLARYYFQQALSIDSSNVENHHMLGLSARALGANLEAREAFAKVKMINEGQEKPFPNYQDAIFYYSIIEKELANEEYAALLREELDSTYKVPLYQFTKIKNIDDWDEIEPICEADFLSITNQISVTSLDEYVNTKYSEASPFLHNGKLYYTSLRFKRRDENSKVARLYGKAMSGALGEEKDAWDEMNIENKTVAHFTFDENNSLMYFTICDYPNKKDLSLQCQIYYRIKNDSVWSEPRPVNDLINQDGYTSTHPSIGYNELNEKVLFYVSDRPGGKGGLDIWSVPIKGPNNFGQPINFSQNTSVNDITPFYHALSNTLYFSSQGHKKWKHYDIYKTEKNSYANNWTTPELLPSPINSNDDDFGYFLDTTSKRAFFVSSRADCGQLENGTLACHDIFQVDYYCAPVLQIELIDSLICEDLENLSVSLTIGTDRILPDSVINNTYHFSNLDTSYIPTLRIEKEGAVMMEKSYKLSACDTIMDIVVIEPLCEEAVIRVEYEKTDYPNAELNIAMKVNKKSISLTGQKEKPYVILNISKKMTFQVEIESETFLKVDTLITLCPCDTATIKLYKDPDPTNKAEYQTIACYFDHDVPGIITPFDQLVSSYSKPARRRDYIAAFTFGEKGENKINNRNRVVNFFDNKVDSSFAILERYRGDLLKAIELLPPDSSYILTIKGYTSDIGGSDYNDRLATRRIQSVWQYFTETHRDKFEKYVLSGKLVLEDQPLGEDKTPPIYQKGDGRKYTRFSPDSAKKRRVEIIRRTKQTSSLFQNNSKRTNSK